MTDSDFAVPWELATAGRRERASHVCLEEQRVIELFDELRAPLFRYLLALGLRSQEAEEAIQESFLALFEHLRRGGLDGNLRGWIFRVAHHLGLKRRTAERREILGLAFDELAATRAEQGENPEEQLMTSQRHRSFRGALAALDRLDRCCLALRAEGLRYREIAQVLGISVGSVAARLARSIERLGRAVIRA